MSIIIKPKPQMELQAESEKEPFTVKCSATKPERALINGGLIIVTIPINALDRHHIIGFMYDSLHYVVSLLDMLDANREKHKKPGLMDGVKEALAAGIGSLTGGK